MSFCKALADIDDEPDHQKEGLERWLSGECLWHKWEDLNSRFSTTIKLDVLVCFCDPSIGRWRREDGRGLVASQSGQFLNSRFSKRLSHGIR